MEKYFYINTSSFLSFISVDQGSELREKPRALKVCLTPTPFASTFSRRRCGTCTLMPDLGMFPETLTNSRISSWISHPGECLSLWTTRLCWIQGQAVILFQPFSNNSHQRRLAGYHRASEVDRESSLGAGDPTTGSGEWFKLQVPAGWGPVEILQKAPGSSAFTFLIRSLFTLVSVSLKKPCHYLEQVPNGLGLTRESHTAGCVPTIFHVGPSAVFFSPVCLPPETPLVTLVSALLHGIWLVILDQLSSASVSENVGLTKLPLLKVWFILSSK